METEKVVATCKRHWTAYLGRGLIAALFILYAPGYLMDGDISGAIISLVIAAVFIAWIIFAYKNEYVMLTTTKVIGHVGLIRSKTLSSPISKIQNVEYSNGLFGKILGCHTLAIDNAGSGRSEFVFKRMANVVHFVNILQKMI